MGQRLANLSTYHAPSSEAQPCRMSSIRLRSCLGRGRYDHDVGRQYRERTNTLSLEIFNAVSRADFDAANALCFILSLFAVLLFLATEVLMRRALKS